MKKKILTILEVLLLLILIKLVATFVINEIFIKKYDNGTYDIKSIKILSFANFPESYIVHYNRGNVYYQNEQFTDAIEEYNKALEKHPTKKKECSIRINLALATLQALSGSDNSEENRNRNIEILKSARGILCEKNCAGENDNNGHSEEAEKLKADIDRMLKKLENEAQGGSDGEEDPEEEEENKKNNQNKTSKSNKNEIEKAEEELMKIQQQSLQERQEELTSNETRYAENSYEALFYEGKRW